MPIPSYISIDPSWERGQPVLTMSRASNLIYFLTSALSLFAIPLVSAEKEAAETGVQVTELADRVRVEINGKLFTEYYFKDKWRPVCYPLIGPGELPMTRNWPFKDTTDEEHDHPHHRSFWFAHGSVNKIDFWDQGNKSGHVIHDSFLELKSGKKVGIIKTKNNWTAADGTLFCTDVRTMRFYTPKDEKERVFDFDITLQAVPDRDLVFGDTKEGTMALRLAQSMRLKAPGHGHIVNSEGIKDNATWGKRADWCDYYGPIENKTIGVAIFDHLENPRHPTWWHVRDYGLFAANPFGKHDFEKLPDKTAGDLRVKAGSDITFRYRFYVHEGDEKSAKVAAKFSEYVKQASGWK